MVAVDGGDELRSVAACEKQRRGGRSEESEKGRGLRGVADGVQGDERKAASRRWPGHRQRSPPSCFGARGGRRQGGRLVGWAAQELGRLGYQVSAR